ncbi:hypothetical protein LX70_00517 [Defluviimonas denitrificans]|jgi:hypothetical protein|uniref:Uncharacterized protein n=1 Tax=Albidovulum denitrificans TaxID=404881 RepID=A0A2S8SCZ6_9RHOB|nr:hypothetical protein [Defluviimonas denitrificans]PQV58705.1 hypothetical protein LX70_00517 [Defluviimonas denitrificans]
METPKQMGSNDMPEREGVSAQRQQGDRQDTPRREGKKPSDQMQATQITDWASI